MKNVAKLFILFLIIVLTGCITTGSKDISIINFDDSAASVKMENGDSDVRLVDGADGKALEIFFHNEINPKVFFGFETPMDWNDKMLGFDVYNPSDKPVRFFIRVDSDESSDGQENILAFVVDVNPNVTEEVMLTFKDENTNHGMKAFGNIIQASWGEGVELDHIIALQFWQWQPFATSTIVIDNIRLIESKADESITANLVDEFGQNAKVNYPGKIHSERQLAKSAKKEEQSLLNPGDVPGRSVYGGYLDEEMRQDATGYFRTAKIDGKWWFIDPEGYPFISTGIDIMRTGDSYTLLTSREEMFTWLPDKDDPLSNHYSYADYLHSSPVPKGVIYNFYTANLERKYGEDWFEEWKETALKRTVSWGFTSFGNWSDPEFWGEGEENKVPYFADGWIKGNHGTLSSGSDYWGEMHNPYDPLFRESVRIMAEDIANKVENDPWCIGVFVDNEMSWGNQSNNGHYGLIYSALRYVESISEVKQAIMEFLRDKYLTIDKLNASWETEFSGWERISDSFNAEYYFSPGMEKDLSSLLEMFADKYFSIVQEELKKVMPNHLYMGSRMADWAMPPEVIRSAARYTDVISFNWYKYEVKPEGWNWALVSELDRPVIIGEFHFGSIDRGHFGGGIIKVGSQEQRADYFKSYMESVLAYPNLVGAHWFQYYDEPVTGRAWDGENHNVGFVSVADEPYTELVEAAKDINFSMYEIRSSD